MAKKILAVIGAIVIVAFVVLGVTTCGIMKVADEALKEREPQLRQYVQMTEEEQNAYVEKNMDELFAGISREIKPDDTKIDKEKLAEMEKDPAVRAAGIQLGRSLVATFIISSDAILKDLSDEDKSKFQAESAEMEKRLEAHSKLVNAYFPKKK